MLSKFSYFLVLYFAWIFPNVEIQNNSSQIPEEIISAIKSGNAKDFAAYFNQNVDILMLSEQKVYSKAQAELIMKDFFGKHQPVDFIILHQGGKEGAKYGIGSYKSQNGNFRIHFLLKIINQSPVIHQLRIEKE